MTNKQTEHASGPPEGRSQRVQPRRGRARALTPEQEQSVLVRYKEGETYKTIATDLAVSKAVIARCVQRNGGGRGHKKAASGRRTLSDEQECQLAADYLNGDGQIILARRYGVAQGTVRAALRRQGVKQRTQAVVNAPGIDVDEAVRLYEQEHLTAIEIGQRLGACQTVVSKHLRSRGVETMNASGKYRGLNHRFFDKLDVVPTYFAGFLAADGNVFGNTIQIGLAAKDHEWLEQFRRAASIPQPIEEGFTNLGHPRVSLRPTSPRWCAALAERYNIVPAKAKILEPPNITDPGCVWAFVRGYFDGDGHADKLGRSIQFTSGSRPFLAWIVRDTMAAHHAIYPHNGSWGCRISGPVLRRVVPLMYAGSTPDTRLARKYERLKGLL